MTESQRLREREREPRGAESIPLDYEKFRERVLNNLRQLKEGQVVIKGKNIPFTQGRQALHKGYMHPFNWHTLAAPDWLVFIQRVITHSGQHVHQGGLGIFVLEGKGYTVVDGVRYDWEEGDLIILPIKAGGCEHQHFNLDPDKPSEWMAIQYNRAKDVIEDEVIQKIDHPDFKKKHVT
jgi:hypothetical protein